MLGAGDRVRGHEVHARPQMRPHVLEHRAFDRAHVGDDRAGLNMGADLLRDLTALADRHACDDEVGARNGSRIARRHLIGDAELGDAPAGRVRARRGDDRTHRARGARRARDRRSDQAYPDQGETLEHRFALGHDDRPRNSASAPTTSRFASSVPTVMRNAFGNL